MNEDSNIEKYLKALLAITLEARQRAAPGDEKVTADELILSRIGFSNKEIAEILGKKLDTVQKIIKRIKK